ncbi:hypothetical protein TSAR_013605 [Trichomalopsis sarcophagae]|uniref:GSKIP domain-containing protein n=1 Tax=Trichomalopsis sarcophagae TaxID=543379 RepID=A0A232EWV8_9HYME|nr:hypothetical protein TSAR_013605 [Trichomalopsis sarcophagae]
MYNQSNEKVLDAEQWKQEAQAIIGDVRDHVRDIVVCDSPALRSNNRAIHLNLTTLEGLEFCVRLSPQGFSIVGNRHNCTDNAKNDSEDDDGEYYETIYSLLNVISPQYRNSFGNSLLDRLQRLSESQR